MRQSDKEEIAEAVLIAALICVATNLINLGFETWKAARAQREVGKKRKKRRPAAA